MPPYVREGLLEANVLRTRASEPAIRMAVKMGVLREGNACYSGKMVQAAQAKADDKTMLPRLRRKVGPRMCEGLDYIGYISHVHSGVLRPRAKHRNVPAKDEVGCRLC